MASPARNGPEAKTAARVSNVRCLVLIAGDEARHVFSGHTIREKHPGSLDRRDAGLDVLARGIERLRRITLGETFWLLSCLRVILPLP